MALYQRFPTGVLQEFLKHAIPDYLVRSTDLFSFRLSNNKNHSSQHNNSHLAWMNQNYTYSFCQMGQKIYIFVELLDFSNQFISAIRWKRLKIAALHMSCQHGKKLRVVITKYDKYLSRFSVSLHSIHDQNKYFKYSDEYMFSILKSILLLKDLGLNDISDRCDLQKV